MKNGWPKIDAVRGRVLFVLDETGKKLSNYLASGDNGSGKLLFVNAEEGNPNAAVRIFNDPIEKETDIKELVRKGYIVRTRADADTKEARENKYERFQKAVESGAQIMTTDYYLPSKFFHSEYHVMFDNHGYVKVNDVVINRGN
jgi:hypothetical protein